LQVAEGRIVAAGTANATVTGVGCAWSDHAGNVAER
jgi:hypothetical protein